LLVQRGNVPRSLHKKQLIGRKVVSY
jgi:hypothetical protein